MTTGFLSKQFSHVTVAESYTFRLCPTPLSSVAIRGGAGAPCRRECRWLVYGMRCKTSAAVLIAMTLTGCAQQRVAEASKAFEQRAAECTSQHLGDKSHLARANCLEPAFRALFAARGSFGDLTDVYLSNRADLAAKLDRGEITLEEAKVRDAQLKRELTETGLARRNAALAALPPPPPLPVQVAPQQTTCTRFGNTVNCSSY